MNELFSEDELFISIFALELADLVDLMYYISVCFGIF